ncbi:hypothetical protein N7467_001343 [Penicillium canescens]|nr:hypothetical protein N7467_001343 [Penicillium canescens]
MGKGSLTDADLRPFLIVSKVLAALQYLTEFNPLYNDVVLEHSTVSNWPDEFIPFDLQQQIIYLDETDSGERVGYTVDLQEDNYESEWQAAEDNRDHLDENSISFTASVTIDINGERQNTDNRVLNTVYNTQ